MYIQPVGRGTPELPFSVPRDYSGNAFRQESPPSPAPPPADIAVPLPPPLAFDDVGGEVPPDVPEMEGMPPDTAPPAAPASATGEEEPPAVQAGGGGLFSRIPFLSSLMPPARGRAREKGGLPDWVLIAALIFLFGGESDEDDILPFLLLLLLWN